MVAALVVAIVVAVACTVPMGSGQSSSEVPASASQPDTSASAGSGSASPSPPASALDTPTAISAARAFLELTSAGFEATADRFKPGQPVEHEWEASGVIDPAGDRGSMRWLLLFPPLSEPAPSETPEPPLAADILWNATDYWAASSPATGDDRQWTHATRERARESAMIGRVQEEPLALVRLAAEADPSAVQPLAGVALDGEAADRWLIEVPLDRAKAAFVPPDTYLGLARIFDVDAFPLEIWTVDGAIRRVGYVLEREKAPYGGPDRFETYYDWSALGDPIDLVMPPSGRIVELD